MLTLEEAREWLRIDAGYNDDIISSLISPAYDYISTTTGLTGDELYNSELCKTVAKFLLTLWYNPEQTDADKLERTIENILKSLGAIASTSTTNNKEV